MKRWLILGGLIFLILVGGVWAASRMISVANAEQAKIPDTGVDIQSLPPVERMQQQLLDPHLDVNSRESLMEKIELVQRVEQAQESGSIAPAPKTAPEFDSQTLMKAVPQIETGIFPGSEGMVRPSLAEINNYWQGVVAGQIVQAFAGSSSDDPQQGVIVVVTSSMDPASSDIHFDVVPAPGETGSIHAVSETNGVLTLENETGTILLFSVAEKRFLP